MASSKDRMPVRMSAMHKVAMMFSAAANPMTQAMVRIYNARLAKEAEAKAKAEVLTKLSKGARTYRPTLPPGLPPATQNWRDNFVRLTGDMRASPLPTRQLRRRTVRQMARIMASCARISDRQARRVLKDPAYAKAKAAAGAASGAA